MASFGTSDILVHSAGCNNICAMTFLYNLLSPWVWAWRDALLHETSREGRKQ